MVLNVLSELMRCKLDWIGWDGMIVVDGVGRQMGSDG